MNLAAAAWKLSTYQVWNRKRRWSTIGLLLFPVILVSGVGIVNGLQISRGIENLTEFYRGFVTIALGTILIPFVSVFWGSAALADEIEGKTLVYLWTRPRHRGVVLLYKLIGVWVWIAALAFVAVGATFLLCYRDPQTGGLTSNLPILLWDWRALTMCGLAYSSVGFLLSFFVRKPLTWGLMIAYAWEIVPTFAPGFIKRLSIRQQIMALTTHKPEEESMGFARKFIVPEVITEQQALLTLVGIIVICLGVSVYMATQREFLSDDPARNQ